MRVSAQRHVALVAVLLILACASYAGAAVTWTHSVIGGYDVWYLNGTTQKFRYNLANQQWWHYSTVGSSWYAISSTGRPDTFIGTGAWFDMGNGFSYQYSAGYDKGAFRDGSEDRFLYKYSSGQWYDSADTLSWQVLGKAGLNAAFLGSGARYDLGNGFTYQYSLAYDKGTFKDDLADRFLYKYVSGQWYHTGNTLSWQVLGKGELNAAFVGSGAWCDLGNEWDYQYSLGYHKGTFTNEYLGASFLYKYAIEQWWHRSQHLTEWNPLSDEGTIASFVGDGEWHLLGTINGASWRYSFSWLLDPSPGLSYSHGYWQRFAHDVWADRFNYAYKVGQWSFWQKDAWQSLGQQNRSSRFLGDGARHELTEGPQGTSYPEPYWTWDVRYDRPTDTMYIGLETSLYENLNSLLEMFRFRFGQAKWDDRNLVWNKWNDMGRFLLTDSSQVGSLQWSFKTPRVAISGTGPWGFPREQEELYQYTCNFGGSGTLRPESTTKKTVITWDYGYLYMDPIEQKMVYGWTASYSYPAGAYKHDPITAEWWYCAVPDSAAPYWEWKRVGDTTAYGWR